MTPEEIKKGRPPKANKYVLYKDGSVVYIRANNFFEYWYEGKWHQCGNSESINFDLYMVGIFPLP